MYSIVLCTFSVSYTNCVTAHPWACRGTPRAPQRSPPTPRGLRSHCSRPGKTQASPPPPCCGATATRLSDRRSPPFKPHAGVHAPPRRLLSSWRAAGPARHAADTQKRRARDICRGEGNPSRSFAPHAPTGTRLCPSASSRVSLRIPQLVRHVRIFVLF